MDPTEVGIDVHENVIKTMIIAFLFEPGIVAKEVEISKNDNDISTDIAVEGVFGGNDEVPSDDNMLSESSDESENECEIRASSNKNTQQQNHPGRYTTLQMTLHVVLQSMSKLLQLVKILRYVMVLICAFAKGHL